MITLPLTRVLRSRNRRRALPSHSPRGRRGVALLLVMIGLIICSILSAGFLASQGTSIGIARNERDANKSRLVAQTGVDMCYWLIRNKSDWRQTMTPGIWLNSFTVGEGTVTVTADDDDHTGNFADDPTAAVKLTSVGHYDNRTYTLIAKIQPTGGGSIFNSGNFVRNSITLGNNDLLTPAVIDSYNSSVAPYNSSSPGSNAAFTSDATIANALTIYFPSVYRGSYAAGPTAILGNVLNALLSILGIGPVTPSTITNLGETRIPGDAFSPNTTGLAARGSYSANSGGGNIVPGTGRFDSFNINPTATAAISTSGTYYITGDIQIKTGGILNINNGINAVLIVDGNFTLSGRINLIGTSTLAIYAGNQVTLASGLLNQNGNTAQMTLYGLQNCNQIKLTGTANISGAVFAPEASFIMQSGNTRFYGAMVVKDLSVTSTGQVHFDEALRPAKVPNIAGGSAPPGTAYYTISVLNAG